MWERQIKPRGCQTGPLSKAERKRLRKLDARYKALYDRYPDGDVPPDVAARMERIEAAVETLQKEEYKPKDMDEPESKAKADDAKKRPAKDADGLAPLSEKLVAELTAYRTSALRNEWHCILQRRSPRSFMH
jgi:hypothetical protein